MKKTTTITDTYCDFCGNKFEFKPYSDECGIITLSSEVRDYQGNGAGGFIIKNGDLCRDCLNKIRELITKK